MPNDVTCHHFHDDKNCLCQVPIFNHLDTSELQKIINLVDSKSYKKNDFLYQPGDYTTALYVIRCGQVKIYRLSESSKEQVIRILKPGDFIGESSIFTNSFHESYAEILEDTDICIIEKDKLDDLMKKYPSIALKFLEEFSKRIEKTERQTTLIGSNSIDLRLAAYLINLYDRKHPKTPIKLTMTKKDLASYLGTTPETISRKLGKFEDSGYIRQISNKEILILDSEALELME